MGDAIRFRIRELEQRSGVKRQTIHYYLREGLLQPPLEKFKNSAWYDQRHVARLRLIRDLRENQFLPLKAIRAIIEEEPAGDFSDAQRQTLATFRDKLRRRHQQREPYHDLQNLTAEIRFTQAEIEQLSKLAWIHPRQAGQRWQVDDCEARLLRAWAAVRDAGLTPRRGFTPDDFLIFDSLLGELAKHAAEMIRNRLGNLQADSLESLYDQLTPALEAALGQTHASKLERELTG
jgi:DNA-binding transcriptional MerR regulator